MRGDLKFVPLYYIFTLTSEVFMENGIKSSNNDSSDLYYNETPEEFQARVDKVVSSKDTSNLSEEEKIQLRNKVAEDIHQDNVNKILLKLIKDIKSLPQEEQDAFWGESKK